MLHVAVPMRTLRMLMNLWAFSLGRDSFLAFTARSCGAHSRRVVHKAHRISDEAGMTVAQQLQEAFLAQRSCRSVADGELPL